MIVKVTQEHIDKGRRRATSACPIALALKEQLGHEVVVGEFSTYIGINSDSIPLPRSAQRFVARFDRGKPVKPFNFRVQLS